MTKDVWILAPPLHHPTMYKAGYGGFSAREGLANATFGQKRVLIVEDCLKMGDLLSYMVFASSIKKLAEIYGKPKYIFTGHQDPHKIIFVTFLKIFKAFPEKEISLDGYDDIENTIDFIRKQNSFLKKRNKIGVQQLSNLASIPSLELDSIIHMEGISHNITLDKILNSTISARRQLEGYGLKGNFISVLVGAPKIRKDEKVERIWINNLAKIIKDLNETYDLPIVVISSPRTQVDLWNDLQQDFAANEKIHFFDYNSDADYNLYPGILGMPENKLTAITHETMTMLSEAALVPNLPLIAIKPWPLLWNKKNINNCNATLTKERDLMDEDKILNPIDIENYSCAGFNPVQIAATKLQKLLNVKPNTLRLRQNMSDPGL